MGSLQPENVEGAVITILEGLGQGEAATKIPNPRPTQFFRVQRTGGVEQNLIQERPTVLIEAFSNGGFPAWQLAAAAWQALQGREPLEVGGVELSGRSLSMPVNYPDPTTDQDRYQFTLTTTVTLKETTP